MCCQEASLNADVPEMTLKQGETGVLCQTVRIQ